MNAVRQNIHRSGATLEILAFRLDDQEFCVKTIAIREIRGWGAATPIPHAPADVVGVMNLRGAVIQIIDLALKLGMKSTTPTERRRSSLPRSMQWRWGSLSIVSLTF